VLLPAQQAAEKALKAVLLAENTDFPNTHNLRFLLDKIPFWLEIPPEVEDAALSIDIHVIQCLSCFFRQNELFPVFSIVSRYINSGRESVVHGY